MKTRKSNLQKAELFSLNAMMILFAAILFLNSNATATEKGTEDLAEILNEKEAALNIESWMIDARIFTAAFLIETESDKKLELEDWMMDESNFFSNLELENERENSLLLESWMTNDSIFKPASTKDSSPETLAMNQTETVKKTTTIEYKDSESGKTFLFKLTETEEPELQLERWMVDPAVWNRKPKTK